MLKKVHTKFYQKKVMVVWKKCFRVEVSYNTKVVPLPNLRKNNFNLFSISTTLDTKYNYCTKIYLVCGQCNVYKWNFRGKPWNREKTALGSAIFSFSSFWQFVEILKFAYVKVSRFYNISKNLGYWIFFVDVESQKNVIFENILRTSSSKRDVTEAWKLRMI